MSRKQAAKTEKLPFDPEVMSGRLLDWYQHQGRDLPWRNSREPYRIWLSEIMLQQTTVAAVIDYYNRFLQRFPSLETLAAAPLEEVLTLWAGLGYYSRARNLHKTARLLAEHEAGCFPQSVEALQKLPGIGRSTAGAIVSLAFDKPEPILDGNVRRLLCRLLAIDEPARDRQVEQRMWRVAEQLVPEVAAHDYTQAIMDLGATVCRPKQPGCDDCPLSSICQARRHDLTAVIPVATKRKPVPVRRQTIVLIGASGQTLLRRREPDGLLGGMLEFPQTDIGNGESAVDAVCALVSKYGCSEEPEPLGSIRHTYSHFRLEAEVYALRDCQGIRLDSELFWQADSELEQLALHGAHKKALALRRQQKKEK